MDPNAHNHRAYQNLNKAQMVIGIKAALLQIIAQVADSTPGNKIRVSICLASLVMNFFAAKWEFNQLGDRQHDQWKTVIFNTLSIYTEILYFYFGISMLAPEWLPWYGFVIICSVVTLVHGYNVLKFIANWFYERFDAALKGVMEKFNAWF